MTAGVLPHSLPGTNNKAPASKIARLALALKRQLAPEVFVTISLPQF